MKNKSSFILILLSIALVAGISWWQFKGWGDVPKKISFPDFNFETPTLEITSNSGEEIKEEIYTSPAKDFQMAYNSDWMEVQSMESALKDLPQNEGEIFFFRQKFNLENSVFAFILAQKVVFDEEKTLEEAISLFQNSETEITGKKTSENRAMLEINYFKDGKIFLNSEELIINEGSHTYFVDIIAPRESLISMKGEIEKIFSSVKTGEDISPSSIDK